MPRSVDPSIIPTGVGSASPGSVSQSALGPGEAGPLAGALDAHLVDPAGAHPASAISIQDVFERYLAGNVEGALGELAALVPPAPGVVGSSGPPWLGSTNTGIPDWGILKLWDGALSLSTVNDPEEIYPYYWRAPVSPNGDGVDPVTDPTFNVVDGFNTYTGGGKGLAHAAFATVSMGPFAPTAYPSWRTLPALNPSTTFDVGFVVSGIVSPADRGVLALLRWPAGAISPTWGSAGSTTDILDRCVAAIKLGLGLADGGAGCDGDPGGIFTEGSPTPYDFPGRAAGQWELNELHTGVARVPGTTAPAAADPTAGQVRLLTDPAALPSIIPPTVLGGMPILGATTAATGGGTNGNFFAYRLPYLKDYSATSGIIYTPAAEKPRYLSRIAPAAGTPVTQAGDYDDFTTDFWAIQVARYRHRYSLGGAAALFRRDDSYALVHFRSEAYFEEFVRDGVVPTADKLYSVNLVSFNGVADPSNLVDLAASPPATSTAYSVNASELVQDPNGLVVPALNALATNTFIFSSTGSTIFTSGVEYYVPLDPTTGAASANITGLDVGIDNVFGAGIGAESAYRSHDTPAVGLGTLGNAVNQNPVFLSLSSFAYEGTELPDTDTLTLSGTALAQLFPASLGKTKRQRVEFGFADINGGLTDPGPTAVATISMVGAASIDFDGDQNTPAFTTNATVRAFVRRPLVVDIPTGYPLPADPLAGLAIANSALTQILFHSMKEVNGPPAVLPTYGNAANTANAVYNTTKDREERFLDEVYRYPFNWASFVALPVPTLANLTGSGLPSGPGAIQVPVRPGPSGGTWDGYYLQGFNSASLVSGPPYIAELQVAGLPERNPPYTDGLAAPFPSRGILLYPQDNYTGYDPSGPDYSTAAEPARGYFRVFDAGAANVGSTTVTLRVWGVELSDFAFDGTAPDYGNSRMAILVKVPGLTTWMDLGRVDGAGPSKQDPALDGAGCRVIGPNTFNATDLESQIRYAQVEVNLGALAPLFLNAEVPARCPLIVGVVIRNTPAPPPSGLDYNWQNVAATAPTSQCRGIVGLEVVLP